MKNLKSNYPKLLSGIALLFLVFIVHSCQEKQEQPENGITQEHIDSMVENHIIPLDEAIEMYKKYSTDRVEILNDTLKEKYRKPDFEDTRMVWFDIKDVRAYLKYLEENTSEAEGLAFYFGVNSDQAQQGKNHQSFFIALLFQCSRRRHDTVRLYKSKWKTGILI